MVTIKFNSRDEIKVFRDMLRWAYNIRTNGTLFNSFDDKVAAMAVSEQLAGIYEKVAIKLATDLAMKKMRIRLTTGSACAIYYSRGICAPVDDYSSIIMNGIIAQLDRHLKSIIVNTLTNGQEA